MVTLKSLACLAVVLTLAAPGAAQVPPAQPLQPEATQPPPPGTTTPPPSDLQAGGLRPPEAVAAPPDQSQPPADAEVERQLEHADTEDTGRGLEFVWLNAEVGYQLVGLQALSDDDLVDGELIENNQQGLVYGAGVGVRLFVLTLGARGRFGNFDSWRLWSVNAEAGLRIPLANLELFFTLGGGYVSVGGFSDDNSSLLDLSKVSIGGFDVRAGAGADYYLSDTFSVGLNLQGDLLVLRRSALAVPAVVTPGEAGVYGTDGSGVGAAFTATAVLGLHF